MADLKRAIETAGLDRAPWSVVADRLSEAREAVAPIFDALAAARPETTGLSSAAIAAAIAQDLEPWPPANLGDVLASVHAPEPVVHVHVHICRCEECPTCSPPTK
jgi:hypothetical protein